MSGESWQTHLKLNTCTCIMHIVHTYINNTVCNVYTTSTVPGAHEPAKGRRRSGLLRYIHVLLIVVTLLFVLIKSGRARTKMEAMREASSYACETHIKACNYTCGES